MFMIRRLTGNTTGEMLLPAFRKVNVGGDPSVLTVTHRLRQCWVTTPVSSFSDAVEAEIDAAIGDQLRRLQNCTDDEVRELMNPDKLEVHTPYRDRIYRLFNHVFWDVSKFLNNAALGVGHHHPPNHAVLPLFYPGSGPDHGESLAGIADKISGVPFLVLPAYIEPGVKVYISSAGWHMGALEGGGEAATAEQRMVEENEGIMFDATEAKEVFTSYEVGWVKAGHDVDITLGGETHRTGLAAVLVLGVLCLCEPVDTPAS